MELSTEIKEARAKLGLSQSQAAKVWEVPVQTLQKWEQGINKPRGLALKMLRSILDAATAAKPASPSSASPEPPGAPPKEKRRRCSSATSPPRRRKPRA